MSLLVDCVGRVKDVFSWPTLVSLTPVCQNIIAELVARMAIYLTERSCGKLGYIAEDPHRSDTILYLLIP